MKKTISVISASVLCVACFTACGNSDSSSSSKATSSVSAETTKTTTGDMNNAGSENKASISIDVSDILDNYDMLDKSLQSEEFVPDDGAVLAKTEYEITEGETAFDLFIEATTDNDIAVDYLSAEQSGFGSAYIQGINSIYAGSCGDASGWMFEVNGVAPEVSSDAFELKAGDEVNFFYVCDYNAYFGAPTSSAQ